MCPASASICETRHICIADPALSQSELLAPLSAEAPPTAGDSLLGRQLIMRRVWALARHQQDRQHPSYNGGLRGTTTSAEPRVDGMKPSCRAAGCLTVCLMFSSLVNPDPYRGTQGMGRHPETHSPLLGARSARDAGLGDVMLCRRRDDLQPPSRDGCLSGWPQPPPGASSASPSHSAVRSSATASNGGARTVVTSWIRICNVQRFCGPR